MKCPLRVVIADDEPIIQMYLEEILSESGMEVVAIASDGTELIDLCRSQHPDLIVSDVRMPNMDGLAAVRVIFSERPVPVILVTGYNQTEGIESAERQCVLAHLVKPVRDQDLRTAIEDVLARFAQFQRLLEEEPNLFQALANRWHVEQAKRLLMRKRNLTDRQAFERLCTIARARRQPIVTTAKYNLADEDF